MKIQNCWIRWSNYAHVKRHGWGEVRKLLDTYGAIPFLCRFSKIRREWRTECTSWVGMKKDMTNMIVLEAIDGLWGPPTARLMQ